METLKGLWGPNVWKIVDRGWEHARAGFVAELETGRKVMEKVEYLSSLTDIFRRSPRL
jgi:hypothetical protein